MEAPSDVATGTGLDGVFERCQVLSNSDVAILLDHCRTARGPSGACHGSPPLSPLVDKTQEYCNNFNCGKNVEFVRATRSVLERSGFTPSEVCLISNLLPETADEALALIPSVKTKSCMEERPVEELQSTLQIVCGYSHQK